MPADLAKDFLRRHPPFFYLQDDELRSLVRAAREEFVRKGDAVPDAGTSLVIVRQGAVAELAGADDRDGPNASCAISSARTIFR